MTQRAPVGANKVKVVMDEVVDKQVEEKVNQVLDEANAVDKEMNEGSVLEDHTVLENGEIIKSSEEVLH